jgi:hypothetical protein
MLFDEKRLTKLILYNTGFRREFTILLGFEVATAPGGY